jgi:hypothetical protein
LCGYADFTSPRSSSVAFTLPGIVAHQSALKGGEPMKIRDYGVARA